MEFLANTIDLYLEAAPWLLLGLLAAAVVNTWVPEAMLGRVLGGAGPAAVIRAALIGAPLPLCSCGVLPAAVGLRRGGASKPATVSFLIATPETGPDSVAITYALMGPFMTVVRPVAAVLSAVLAGLLTGLLERKPDGSGGAPVVADPPGEDVADACCGGETCGPAVEKNAVGRLRRGLAFAFIEVMDDIAPWLLGGLVVAGATITLVPPMAFADWGRGLPAMLAMLAASLPIYVCATASTPIAAALLVIGVSPGAVLVFLLAGPATNVATIGVVGRLLGTRALIGYLGGIALGAVLLGLATDALVTLSGLDVAVQAVDAGETIPAALEIAAGIVMAPLLGWPLVRRLRPSPAARAAAPPA